MREWSDGGARIELVNVGPLPQEFELDIPSKRKTYFAKRVWLSGSQLDVDLHPDGFIPLQEAGLSFQEGQSRSWPEDKG